jgi:uncharacterized protein (TIGR02246 family)
MTDELYAPEHLHALFQSAFNRQDIDAIVALYEPAAVLVRAGTLARGTDAIRAAYRAVLAQPPRIEVQTISVICTGNLAVLRGTWVWRGVASDGKAVHSEGRNIETVRLQADGRWLFVIDDPGVSESLPAENLRNRRRHTELS